MEWFVNMDLFIYSNIETDFFIGFFKHIRVGRITVLIGWTSDTLKNRGMPHLSMTAT